MPNQPSSASMHAELAQLRRKTGVLRGVKNLARPTFAGLAVTGAWSLGYALGTAIYAEVNPQTVATNTTHYRAFRYEPVYGGEQFTVDGQTYTYPDDGWVVGYNTAAAPASSFTFPQITTVSPPGCGQETTIASFSGGSAGFLVNRLISSGTTYSYCPSMDAMADISSATYIKHAYVPAKLTATTTPIPGAAVGDTLPPNHSSVRTALQNELQTNPSQYGNTIRWLDAVTGGTSANPLVVDVPSCVGLQYAECADLLTELELVPVQTTLTLPEADLTKPAGAVVQTDPDAGSEAMPGTEVEVQVNPDPMPLVIPAPNAGETAAAYLARLQALGLVGSVTELTQETASPWYGPDAVVSVAPVPGTRVEPGTTVTVVKNPATAANPGPTAPGGVSGPGIPAINLEPLRKASATDRFPFGVPAWVLGAMGGWGGAGNCPAWDFEFPYWDQAVTLDMCVLQPGVDVVRPVVGFGAFVLCMWFFMGAALGFGGGRSD